MTNPFKGIQVEEQRVKLTLTSKMLGTAPKNKDVYTQFIATKKPDGVDETEIETTPEEAEGSGWTGFHSDKDGLFIYDYMIRGSIKSCIESLVVNGAITKIPAYKKWVDRLVFIDPRKIHFGVSEPDGYLERPIRVDTPKGPRVTVTKSDCMNEGRTLEFTIRVLENKKGLSAELVFNVLSYGQLYGLGQWRGSGGYGQFTIEKSVARATRRRL